MSVKRVDPVTNRLVRGSSFERVEGAEQIAQAVDVNLKIQVGEAAWDLTLGTGWIDLILVKGTPPALILGELTRVILSAPGMLTVDSIEATRTGERSIRVDWSGTGSLAQLAAATTISGSTEITI